VFGREPSKKNNDKNATLIGPILSVSEQVEVRGAGQLVGELGEAGVEL
jgi:hypothetical protein